MEVFLAGRLRRRGFVVRVGDQAVQIQIAERVRVDISRNAVVGYQGQEPVAPEGSGTSS